MTGNRMVRKILSAGCRVPNSPRVQVETKDYNDPHCEPEPIDAGLGALSTSALAALAELQILLAQQLLAITNDNFALGWAPYRYGIRPYTLRVFTGTAVPYRTVKCLAQGPTVRVRRRYGRIRGLRPYIVSHTA
ncbi:hypothetical protein B0H14DRAFT_3162491 [Mycena olivaceomarginata]|nr:hypothetical protein B0H14DRAFT_3162491 [Mycena olivaceomarginata]